MNCVLYGWYLNIIFPLFQGVCFKPIDKRGLWCSCKRFIIKLGNWNSTQVCLPLMPRSAYQAMLFSWQVTSCSVLLGRVPIYACCLVIIANRRPIHSKISFWKVNYTCSHTISWLSNDGLGFMSFNKHMRAHELLYFQCLLFVSCCVYRFVALPSWYTLLLNVLTNLNLPELKGKEKQNTLLLILEVTTFLSYVVQVLPFWLSLVGGNYFF